MDTAILVAAGLLLMLLGLWGIKRGGRRPKYAGIGFVAGGAIAIGVALLLMAGLVRA